MATTALHGYVTPEGPAVPTVHLDMKVLADDIDADTYVICTSTTRPAHLSGRRIFETNTKLCYISDGTTWQPVNVGVPRGHAGRTAGFQTLGGTDVAITLDAAQITRGGMTFETSSGGRFVIPVAGLYRINAQVYFTGGSAYQAQAAVFKNSSKVGMGAKIYTWKADASDYISSASTLASLAAGDRVGLGATSASSTWGTDGYNGSYLEVELVGV